MEPNPEATHPHPVGYDWAFNARDSWRSGRLACPLRAIEREDQTITLLLREWCNGDEQATDRLVSLIYDELRRLARRELRRDRPGHTLQPTELVHEAYGRLVDLELSWQDRLHFYRMAARTMRRVLVDHARARRAEKRGGGVVMVTLDEIAGRADPQASDVLDLADALERLAKVDERLSRGVELFYFGGLTYDEIAQALGTSCATVDRDLRFARAWLRRELARSDETGGADGG